MINLCKKQGLSNEQNDCKKYSKQVIVHLMQKTKKTSKKTNKQLCNTDMTTFYKIQKLVTTKKCNTHFVITERKKNMETHEKISKPNIYVLNR